MSIDWEVYTLGSDLITWELYSTWPRPNENLEQKTSSTSQIVTLADGSQVIITPEIKKSYETFNITFINASSALIDEIDYCLDNSEKIKIVTHTTEEIICKIMDKTRVWFSGRDDQYDIQITVKPLLS
jgi:hypothetical protein